LVVTGSVLFDGDSLVSNGGAFTAGSVADIGGGRVTMNGGFLSVNGTATFHTVSAVYSGTLIQLGGNADFGGAGTVNQSFVGGTMTVSGDFHQATSTAGNPFLTSNDHLTNFIGSSAQSVRTDDPATSKFSRMQFANSSAAGVSVFDVRVLPNPYYIRELRPLNGRDEPVALYLRAQPEVMEMLDQIEGFLVRWLPAFEADQRSYLTVAIGCTGGQHRSVFFAETLSRRFAERAAGLIRHRELDAR
jgi:hypothetical protein